MNTQILKFIFYSLLVTFISSEVMAQERFTAGIKAGLSTSQVDGDTYSGFNKIGFDGGAFVTGKLNEKWTGQFEIIFIQKGSKHNANAEIADYNFYLLQLSYIEVPVLLQYHHKKYAFELGPGFGYLINEKEYFNGQDISGISPFNKKEINFNLGINYIISKKLGIDCRYSYSITPIREHSLKAKTWYNPGQMNDVLAFTLTYKFGGGKTE